MNGALRAPPARSTREADRRPGLRHRFTAPGQAFHGQLVTARAQRRAVEFEMQVAVRIALHVVQDSHATLIDAIDGDAEGGEL